MTGALACKWETCQSGQLAVCAHCFLLPCRYHVHVTAEAYGLAHASHGDGPDRVIKVGKLAGPSEPSGLGASVVLLPSRAWLLTKQPYVQNDDHNTPFARIGSGW